MGSLRGCIGPSGTADAVCKEVETRIESARACARSSLCRAAQIFAQNRRRGLGTWFGERHTVSSAAAHAMCKACMLPQEAVGLFQPQAWQMAVRAAQIFAQNRCWAHGLASGTPAAVLARMRCVKRARCPKRQLASFSVRLGR